MVHSASVRESMIASGVLDSLVLLVFIFRLWIRIRMQRVGWEDIWATIAFFCGMLNVTSNWAYLGKLKVGQVSTTAMWIYMISLTCLVWAVRVSIIFSIIRIIPARERLHIHGLMIVTFFLLTCSALVVQRAISCSYAYRVIQSSTSSPYFSCSLRPVLIISELAVGAIADIITVIFPLYVLRRVTLPRKQLRLLRLLFSSSIAVSIMCSVRMAFQIVPSLTSWAIFMTDIQVQCPSSGPLLPSRWLD
ncbi:hypothetical protein L210DRAFT_3533124 [Boletus edulis BED1]|uniref:Rhodopsin domain-containing protein n=1 Tax=Boletus edulis BED1 TaxID=1328754 RepID=A0AAD4GHB1_BOLED|nr:hypothetical protein L210DRAFT_3533124 [Boletus edulis BED1]